MTIFSIVVVAFLGLFVSAFKEQQKSLARMHLINNGSYVLEYMTRSLRMARKDLTGTCLANPKYNYENPGGDTSAIKFLIFDDSTAQLECQQFFKSGNTLMVQIKAADSSVPMLPADIIVERLNFLIIGDGQGNNLQPKVVLVLKIKTMGVNSQTMNLQTAVSQRDLDVSY